MMRKGIALLAALLVLGAAGSAWAIGLGIGYRLPTGAFGDEYDGGYGANFALAFPVAPTVTAWGDVGYTRFRYKDISVLGATGVGDIDVWGFNAGAKVGVGMLYLGAEAGYFTEIDEFGLTPLVGIGFSVLDLSARYKATGDANWWDLRASISFGP